jgi:hypothetical protein
MLWQFPTVPAPFPLSMQYIFVQALKTSSRAHIGPDKQRENKSSFPLGEKIEVRGQFQRNTLTRALSRRGGRGRKALGEGAREGL